MLPFLQKTQVSQGSNEGNQEYILQILRQQEAILEQELLEVDALVLWLCAPELAEHLQARGGEHVRLHPYLRV